MLEQEKTYSQMRNDFYKEYQNTILPCIKKFDKSRIIHLVFAVSLFLLFFTIGILILFGTISGELFLINLADDSMKVALAFISGAFWVYFVIKKGFESELKDKIMPIVCSCFSNNLMWYENTYMGSYKIHESGLLGDYEDESYDDIFEGTYKGVKFEIAEAVYRKKGYRHNSVIFQGVIIRVPMNKTIETHTIIKLDSMVHISPVYGLRHTTLEDVVFEKNFDVFTDNEVEARYLITPSFMQRLNSIKKIFLAGAIECAFYKDELIIALHTSRDLFSIGSLITPIDDSKQYFQMFEEILSIIKLIDHFKLDQKIGL